MQRMITDSHTRKEFGVIRVVFAANTTPASPAHTAPTPKAISFAFTFLLYLEVIDLVFGLATSVSRAVGKQFEIFSLILLRQSFKDFSTLPEPLRWPESPDLVLHILSNAGGALLIFGILIFYYRTLLHAPITADEEETFYFISTKKSILLNNHIAK